MPLVTDPGLSTSDAYVSLEDFKTYCDDRGHAYPEDDTAIEQAIRRATMWIDSTYRERFPGEPTNTFQALEWPRAGVVFRGEELPDDEIPRQIEWAASEASLRELASPGSLSPDVTPGTVRTRVRVEGAVDVSYREGGDAVASQMPILSIVDGILSGLLLPKRGSTLTGFVSRA